MLSATVAAFDEPALGDRDSRVDVVEQDAGDSINGLPSGVGLIVCPGAGSGDGGSAEAAPTAADETDESIEGLGPSTWALVGCWLPDDVCALPPPTSTPTGDDEPIDPGDPADVAAADVDADRVVDPETPVESALDGDPVIAPVVCFPFEPLDVRVQFVSSDAEYACDSCVVGPDEAVEDTTVFASDNESSILILAFIPDQRDDGSDASEDIGEGRVIHGVPLDVAALVPETGVPWASPDVSATTEVIVVDPIPDAGESEITGESSGDSKDGVDSTREPTLDADRAFVSENPTCPNDHGADCIQRQVVTDSGDLPWIEFGTPDEPRAFHAWDEEPWRSVTLPEASAPAVSDPIVTAPAVTAPTVSGSIVAVGDVSFLPIEAVDAAVLPPVLPARSTSTVAVVRSPAADGFSVGMSSHVMAAFAANVPAAGGDVSVLFGAGRRRR